MQSDLSEKRKGIAAPEMAVNGRLAAPFVKDKHFDRDQDGRYSQVGRDHEDPNNYGLAQDGYGSSKL